jgi:eukaryotic-like serine/threonine-protein kinase
MIEQTSPMLSAGVADESFAAVVEEIARRVQSGEDVDWQAYRALYPERAEQLRDLMPAMQALMDLSRSGRSAGRPAKTETPGTGRTLGDFRIERELGRGGMGVVYQAEQLSLSRRVALKVLPMAGLLDERQLQRFKNEARAAASLHHPHIVPVFSVGSDKGVHYYAMQLIEGRTLDQFVRQLRGDENLQQSQLVEPVTPPTAAPADATDEPFINHNSAGPRPVPHWIHRADGNACSARGSQLSIAQRELS